MANTGKEFGVDLYGLKRVAKSDLPTVAGAYGTAVGNCESAQGVVDGIPAVPQELVADEGAVFGKYQQAHEAVIELLRNTRNNLDDTAETLNQAAEQYEEDDRAAAAELQRIIDERGEPKPE
ncbi:hypothetical protein GCM10027174_17640 [Salinifilum aidingensis]